MPLIIMCGFPCSGKSQRAQTLYEHFAKKNKTVLIRDENVLSTKFCRNEVFKDTQKENELRSAIKAEVERTLSKSTVVIVDYSNYIRGYRYELYCISKSCKTTHCLVYCDLLPSDSWIYNIERATDSYEKGMFYQLIQRFEMPTPSDRWDNPMFFSYKDEDLPIKDIENALFERTAPIPNTSTQCQPLSTSNFLYDLDRMTQKIVKEVLRAQLFCVTGDEIRVPKADLKVILGSPVSTGDLARIRRQFISYTRSHPTDSTYSIPNMFVQYLNKNIAI